MFVHTVPNRNSPPAILLREGHREDGKVRLRTIANLTKWPPQRIEVLKRCLRGELDDMVGDMVPVTGRIFGTLYIMFQLQLDRNRGKKLLVAHGSHRIEIGKRRRYMYGYPTENDGEKAVQEIYGSSEAGDFEGMGIDEERGGGFTTPRYSSDDPVSLEEAIGGGGCGVSHGDPIQSQPGGQGTAERESAAQGHGDAAFSGADVVEKKDELGLTGRQPGESYSQEQRQRIVDTVARLKSQGVSTLCALRGLRVPRSTIYYWRSDKTRGTRQAASNALLEDETRRIVSMKEDQAHLSHRHISGLLRGQDVWVSPSSCYRVLKSRGLVWEWTLRESPWKVARYEPYEPNRIWGEDWTGILIGGQRHYVLTILDLFSRYLVAWGIFRTVTQREVKNLVALAVMSQGIDEHDLKPILRTDPGSPNMAADVRIFLREIGVAFSPGRVSRPTDNARQERFYRTLKQEEVYCHDGYASPKSAQSSIGYWIDHYNEVRPHQALFGYSPAYVHRLGNKTRLLEEYRANVDKAKQKRRQEWILKNQKLTTSFTGNV